MRAAFRLECLPRGHAPLDEEIVAHAMPLKPSDHLHKRGHSAGLKAEQTAAPAPPAHRSRTAATPMPLDSHVNSIPKPKTSAAYHHYPPAHRSRTAATPMPPSSRIQICAITSPSLMRPAARMWRRISCKPLSSKIRVTSAAQQALAGINRHEAGTAGRTGGDGAVGLVDGVDVAVIPVVDGLQSTRYMCAYGVAGCRASAAGPPPQLAASNTHNMYQQQHVVRVGSEQFRPCTKASVTTHRQQARPPH